MANINLNTARLDDLTKISGLGRDKAEAIIKYRTDHGPFKNWGELNNVPGFSQPLIDVLKRHGVNFGEKKVA